ncbi:MAG: hypothetical protein ACI9SY_000391 [Candidatus Paceibacteria bacterium]|jgi:hypothetical protein
MPYRNFLQKNIDLLTFKYLQRKIQTPLHKAVADNAKRRKNTELVKEVSDFLEADVPEHFQNNLPIFYLSRYIATPDLETLNYCNQVSAYNWPIIIGEDPSDIFTTHGSLKRNLLKLPVACGTSKNKFPILEYITIGDFNSQQGKRLRDVTLYNQMPITTFHKKLCAKFLPHEVAVIDESQWVDRHSRGKLVTLYEKLLPLFLVNGIMLEQYEPDELGFLESVVMPAFETTKKRFGYAPLIAPLDLDYPKNLTDVNSYPEETGDYIREILNHNQ